MENVKKEHPYAQVLRWIADGERVEWRNSAGDWQEQSAKQNLNEAANSDFHPATYRIKPKTITVGKYEVAEPMKVAPAIGTRYWWLDFRDRQPVDSYEWTNGPVDKSLLKSGMCWLNPEDAELAAKAFSELLLGAP